MEDEQMIKKINQLLDQCRAQCDPPTIERLAEELDVAPKSIYMWRKGEKIGKLSRILLRLMPDQTPAQS